MITCEIYDVTAAPTKDTNTIDDQSMSAELYLARPLCRDIEPSGWTVVVAAGGEQEYQVLLPDADEIHEMQLVTSADAPTGQGTRIGTFELRRVRVRPGWTLYVRVKP